MPGQAAGAWAGTKGRLSGGAIACGSISASVIDTIAFHFMSTPSFHVSAGDLTCKMVTDLTERFRRIQLILHHVLLY